MSEPPAYRGGVVARLAIPGLVLASVCVGLAGCSSSPEPAPPATTTPVVAAGTSATSGVSSAAPSSVPSSASDGGATSASTDVPPGTATLPPGQARTPPPAGGSFFSPTAPSDFSLSGPVTVDQALQDPFGNLLQRGALHNHPVTLDVVATPDYPWIAGATTLLFSTCRCDDRGQGLRLTVSDPTAVSDAGNGAVRIRGTFAVTVTDADAMTLTRA